MISVVTLGVVFALSFGLDAYAKVTAADTAKYDLANGESVYNTSCAACHANGILKAPKTDAREDWTARLSQGMDILVIRNPLRVIQMRGACLQGAVALTLPTSRLAML